MRTSVIKKFATYSLLCLRVILLTRSTSVCCAAAAAGAMTTSALAGIPVAEGALVDVDLREKAISNICEVSLP